MFDDSVEILFQKDITDGSQKFRILQYRDGHCDFFRYVEKDDVYRAQWLNVSLYELFGSFIDTECHSFPPRSSIGPGRIK